MDLRPGERAVLSALVEAGGRVVSRDYLARKAGLRDASPRRIDGILVQLRKQLGDDVLLTVRGRGWMLTQDIHL